MRISITKKNFVNIDNNIIKKYAMEYGETINTAFCRRELIYNQGLNSDNKMDKYFAENGQAAIDKMFNGIFHEELNIEDKINKAWAVTASKQNM